MKFSEYFGTNFEFADKDDLTIGIRALILAEGLSPAETDTLSKAWNNGLMESGDTPCKGARGSLLEKGILCQTCWVQSDYTFSVTYPLGYRVIKALKCFGGRE